MAATHGITSHHCLLTGWFPRYTASARTAKKRLFPTTSSIVARVSVAAEMCLSSRYQAMVVFVSHHMITIFSEVHSRWRAETHVYLHVKFPLFLSYFKAKSESNDIFYHASPISNSAKLLPAVLEFLDANRPRRDMAKQICAFLQLLLRTIEKRIRLVSSRKYNVIKTYVGKGPRIFNFGTKESVW
jgi:hypothetical protein